MANTIDYKITYDEKYGYDALKNYDGKFDIFLYDSEDNGTPVLRFSGCFDTMREAIDVIGSDMDKDDKVSHKVEFPDGSVGEYLQLIIRNN